MARMCDICGKGVMSGNKVSKSYNHTRKTWRPNLHTVKADLGDGGYKKITICSNCLSAGYVTKKVRVPKAAAATENK